jgi:ArsR family transcriptional regulator, arsenate/arsenite/antimonite-responsive transcriptional repressor
MNEKTLNEIAQLFLTLSDKTRLRLLSLMTGGEVSVGFLADSLGESQPKVSRHLAYLRNAGLVSTRRDGKHVYYFIEQQNDAAVAHMLQTTINVIAGEKVESFSESDWESPTNDYIYDVPHVNNRESEELEIFLL